MEQPHKDLRAAQSAHTHPQSAALGRSSTGECAAGVHANVHANVHHQCTC